MTFVAVPASGSPLPPLEPESPIINDGFFPNLDPAKLREDMRIAQSISPPRLREAARGAIISVAIDLRSWAKAQRAAGHETLAAVPAGHLDGESQLILLYRRAVGLLARAELIERHRDFDTTAAGGKQIDELTDTADELRRDARHAVRDILGITRTAVDLI